MTADNILGISGQIAGVTLSSFLQMIEMEQKTCTIKVLTKKNMGRIYFLNGALIDAETVRLKHLEAVYDILEWRNTVIEVEKNSTRKQDRINLPLMHILIESAKRADEKNQDGLFYGNGEDPSAKKTSLKILKNDTFCLETGCRLLIDFDSLAVSFRSSLVGIEPGKYLLLKTPGPVGKMDRRDLRSGEMVVKSLYKGTVYAFRSKLMALISEPSDLMFIAYPEIIEHHELRSHKRFRCNIVAQAKINETERGGVIENISRGGCLCVLETFSTDTGLKKHLMNNTVLFRCRFPGSKADVRFMGEIKNARRKSDEMAVGIQFIYMDKDDDIAETINNYIRLIEYSGENV